MKAITYTKYGGPEVLQLKEVEKPVPKDNEVLVRVQAVSINDWDWGLIQGATFFDRMMSGLSKPKREIVGSDIAGRIEAVGKSVTRFKIGDEVYGDLSGTWGGFAEYVCAREKALAIKPASMSFIDAASIPQAAMLAVQGLRAGNIRPGIKLLINGAGGGVGTFGVQIAKLYDGVEITGVDTTSKLDMMRAMGFDHVIDYTKNDFTKNGQKYDLILDTKTNRRVSHYTRALTSNGIYVTVGGILTRLLRVLLKSPFVALSGKKRVRIVALKVNKDLAYMNELFEAGKIKTVIDGPYTLEETPRAFEIFARGEHKGKMVITI